MDLSPFVRVTAQFWLVKSVALSYGCYGDDNVGGGGGGGTHQDMYLVLGVDEGFICLTFSSSEDTCHFVLRSPIQLCNACY